MEVTAKMSLLEDIKRYDREREELWNRHNELLVTMGQFFDEVVDKKVYPLIDVEYLQNAMKVLDKELWLDSHRKSQLEAANALTKNVGFGS
jgi:hypothetical protein